jgi:hypothetical protein
MRIIENDYKKNISKLDLSNIANYHFEYFLSPQILASRTLRCIAPMVCNNPLSSHPVVLLPITGSYGVILPQGLWLVWASYSAGSAMRDPAGTARKIFFHYIPGSQSYPSVSIFSPCKKLIYLELIVAILLQNA